MATSKPRRPVQSISPVERARREVIANAGSTSWQQLQRKREAYARLKLEEKAAKARQKMHDMVYLAAAKAQGIRDGLSEANVVKATKSKPAKPAARSRRKPR